MSVGDNVAYWIESGIGVKFQSRHVEQGKVIALDGDHLQYNQALRVDARSASQC